MRRIVIPLVIVAVVALASPASAARLRAYRGETSAGTRIAFVLRVADDGSLSMKRMFIKVEMLCEDASTIEYRSHWSFGGGGDRLDGRRWTFDADFGYEALHLTGKFRAQAADGTYENLQASLTDADEAQLCTTGELTWSADRVPRDRAATLLSREHADVVHRANGDAIRRVATGG